MEERQYGANMARDEQLAKAQGAYGAAAGLCAGQAMLGEVRDPWKHRSDGMRCKTCMWFAPKAVSPERRAELGYMPSSVGAKLFDLGRCRRHAPTMGGYPVVYVNDWCGDHRVDENKI